MTSVVPTSEEDPALSVVRFTSQASWADAGPDVVESEVSRLCAEAQECIVRGRWLDLVTLMLASADVIFSKVSDKDLECIFTVICNLVTKAESLDESLKMAELIATKLTQRPEEKAALRLKIMFNLYNLLDNPYGKFVVYMKALELAVIGNVTEHIIPSFKKMDTFLKEWDIEIEDQRNLYLKVSNVLKENKSSAKDSFKFLTKYLATFSENDAKLNEAKEEAVRSIVEFVKAPDTFQCDLLNMPAVAQLEKDDKYASLYELLKIFLTQKLSAYLEFNAANPDLLAANELVHEDCVTKMRLLSLVDLASAGSGQISYVLIRDVLQINDDEVEMWVVKAITTKLVDCKMDQMNQTVIVSRCIDRTFGKLQWQTLRSKLATWRANIANVINTIQTNKPTEDVTPAAQTLMIH